MSPWLTYALAAGIGMVTLLILVVLGWLASQPFTPSSDPDIPLNQGLAPGPGSGVISVGEEDEEEVEEAPAHRPVRVMVQVRGNPSEVWLADRHIVDEGYVAPGTYPIYAIFDGNERVIAGMVEVRAGEPVIVRCSRFRMACSAR